MRRVVVAGLGAITPIGNTVSEMWESVKAGKCGIDKITAFDTTDRKVTLAGEVKNYHPEEFLDKRDSVEDIIAYRLENERLHKCLSKLKDEEKQIIDMLYFENKTERQVAEILKTTQQNLHKKKLRILRKIKIFLENA